MGRLCGRRPVRDPPSPSSWRLLVEPQGSRRSNQSETTIPNMLPHHERWQVCLSLLSRLPAPFRITVVHMAARIPPPPPFPVLQMCSDSSAMLHVGDVCGSLYTCHMPSNLARPLANNNHERERERFHTSNHAHPWGTSCDTSFML